MNLRKEILPFLITQNQLKFAKFFETITGKNVHRKDKCAILKQLFSIALNIHLYSGNFKFDCKNFKKLRVC